MTPAEYAAKFWALNVFVSNPPDDENPPPTPMALPTAKLVPGKPIDPGQWRRIRADRYRLNDSGHEHLLVSAIRREANLNFRIMRIDGSVQTHSASFSEISYALIAPFWGKGYPEEFQIVLQLWARYGLGPLNINTLITSGAIGLDCNGFVGGYIERREAPSNWWRRSATKTSYYIKDLLGPPSSYFKSWDDFQPPGSQCLLLGLCDAAGNVKDHNPKNKSDVGHLAITEPGTLAKPKPHGPVTVDVLESTGPVGSVGLKRSTYSILSITKDSASRAIFRVRRGSKIGTPFEFALFRITGLP